MLSEKKFNFWQELAQDLADYGDEGDGALDQATFDKAAQVAEADGLEVLTRRPNELLLDLDTEEQMARLRGMIDKRPGMLRVVEIWKSKNNHHARIELWTDIEPVEALLLQACFGSDPVREALCFIRLKNGVKEPSRLFTPRERQVREIYP